MSKGSERMAQTCGVADQKSQYRAWESDMQYGAIEEGAPTYSPCACIRQVSAQPPWRRIGCSTRVTITLARASSTPNNKLVKNKQHIARSSCVRGFVGPYKVRVFLETQGTHLHVRFPRRENVTKTLLVAFASHRRIVGKPHLGLRLPAGALSPTFHARASMARSQARCTGLRAGRALNGQTQSALFATHLFSPPPSPAPAWRPQVHTARVVLEPFHHPPWVSRAASRIAH